MANWDIVLPYDATTESFLEDSGYPHPAVRPGNRLPTTGEMKWALETQGGLRLNYPSGNRDFYVFERGKEGFTIVIRGFNWDKDAAMPDDTFAMRWMCELQAMLLTRLCERCGQSFLYPDSGAPAVLFEAGMSPERVVALREESDQHEDSWAFFFNAMYGRNWE